MQFTIGTIQSSECKDVHQLPYCESITYNKAIPYYNTMNASAIQRSTKKTRKRGVIISNKKIEPYTMIIRFKFAKSKSYEPQ